MRSVLLASIAVALTVAGPATPADGKSQREKAAQQFEQFWGQRLQGYANQAGQLNAQHKSAVDAFRTKPFAFADGDDRLTTLVKAADGAAYVSGKGQELEAFLERFKSRPSLGLLQAYLQERISVVTSLPPQVEAKRQEMLAVAQKPNARLGDFLTAVEAAAMARGDAIGRSEELKLILENAGAFASDHAVAAERDAQNRARWAAALGAIGQSLNRQRYTVNCTGFGNMVNCTGQ